MNSSAMFPSLLTDAETTVFLGACRTTMILGLTFPPAVLKAFVIRALPNCVTICEPEIIKPCQHSVCSPSSLQHSFFDVKT